jgi:HrpA-like RNA helicase
MLNYELVDQLVCYIIEAEAAGGPGALLNPGDRAAAEKAAGSGGAILVFMPGAAEIDRTVKRTVDLHSTDGTCEAAVASACVRHSLAYLRLPILVAMGR